MCWSRLQYAENAKNTICRKSEKKNRLVSFNARHVESIIAIIVMAFASDLGSKFGNRRKFQ